MHKYVVYKESRLLLVVLVSRPTSEMILASSWPGPYFIKPVSTKTVEHKKPFV